jgi:hypothetical protein
VVVGGGVGGCHKRYLCRYVSLVLLVNVAD